MRAVIQRVTSASVTVENQTVGEIRKGLVVLLGIARDDTKEDADYLVHKIAVLRIFDDDEGRMNISLTDTAGGLLVISQFTLYGDVCRGLRTSWSAAAQPEVAEPLYEYFFSRSREVIHQSVKRTFRQMEEVKLFNS